MAISQPLRRWHSHGKSRALLRGHRNEHEQVSAINVRLLRGKHHRICKFFLQEELECFLIVMTLSLLVLCLRSPVFVFFHLRFVL